MSKTITISDEAWIILHDHMCLADTYNIEAEMNELFAIADQVWGIYSNDAVLALKQIKADQEM